jgi:hypothetical protein
MPISIAGSGTITGISVGGIPDGVVDTDVLAANAVTYAKIGTTEQGQLCKAWVNFNGTGTVAIRASYNVSSITDNGVGDYTVNFSSALVDANYSVVINTNRSSQNTNLVNISRLADELAAPTASAVRIAQGVVAGDRTLQREDVSFVSVAIFR